MKEEKKFRIPPTLMALLVYALAMLAVILSVKYLTLLTAPFFFAFVIAYLYKLPIPTPLTALLVYSLLMLGIILSLKYLTLLAIPLFFSFVIAYLFNPVVGFLEKKTPFSRAPIAGFLMVGLVFVLLFLIINLFPYVVEQVKHAADKFPSILENFSEKMKVVSNYISKNLSEYMGTFDLMKEVEKMIGSGLTNLKEILVAAFSSLYSFLITLVYLVFIPMFSYYFLKDYKKIQATVFGLIPLRFKGRMVVRVEKMDSILSSFIRGQAIVVFILTIFYSVGLSIIGLPFAILIGIIAGVGDIIPYFGTILGFILSLIVGFTHYGSMQELLMIFLVFSIVKGTENWFLYPKIVGKEVGLHFVWVLMAIVIFGKLFGFWGLLVAIPTAAGFKVYVTDLIKYYRGSNYFNKE
ncbi:MAG: AI-2E family transporter [bacterium]|nr:AI-2E family transporter [bacterium]